MDIYDRINEKIMACLDKGVIPWRCPWQGGESGIPRNFVSTKPYKGVNPWLLNMARLENGYSSPFWLTYKQAMQLGGNVKKGEKSNAIVVFYKKLSVVDKKHPEKPDGENTIDIPFLRYSAVFNVDQCEGLTVPDIQRPIFPNDAIDNAEFIVNSMPNPPAIKIALSHRAFYRPDLDSVTIPQLDQFPNPAEYYSVLFHELGHSTGHKSRLARDGITAAQNFGNHEYSKEELVAEFTASYLCAIAGIVDRTIDNSAAYIDSWLRVLKDKQARRWIPWACAQAQRAADYIRNEYKRDSDENTDQVAA